MRRERLVLTGVLCALLMPSPARAQLGAIEAFARRVSDLSFYFATGGLAGSQSALERKAGGVTAFGVGILFEVTEIDRPVPGAATPSQPDSVRRVWTTMEVTHSADGVDTVYTYEVERLPTPVAPTEAVWVVEMGLGYGQLQGYELEDPSLDMNVAVRDLPSVTLYASYEPWGNYFGLRTGFMRTQALQVIDQVGEGFTGDADAFLFGGLVGYAFAFENLWAFIETAYTLRKFPSVEWRGSAPFPPGLPRELNMSAWSVSAGIQVPFR